MKNKTNSNKVFPNYKVDDVGDNQSKRKYSMEGKVQRRKSYSEILKTDRNAAGKLEQRRNEGAVEVMANEGCSGVDFKMNESHVTKNSVKRGRLKTEKPKIVNSWRLGDINNVFLTSETVHDYERANFKVVTSPPEFYCCLFNKSL